MSERNTPDTTGLTFEKILYIFQESDRKSQESYQRLDKLLDKTGKRLDETRKRLDETRKRLDETGKHLDETRKTSKKWFVKSQEEFARSQKKSQEEFVRSQKEAAEFKERHDRFEKELAEIGELIKENGKQMKRTDAELGRLGNRFGEMIEHLVAAGVADRFDELNYHFHGVYTGNFKAKNKNGQILAEADILLENDDFIIAVEVKAKPDQDDVNAHLARLKILQQYFKKHREKEKKVIGAIAGAIFPDKVKQTVIDNGLYAIVQSGDTIKIDVPDGFKPQLF